MMAITIIIIKVIVTLILRVLIIHRIITTIRQFQQIQ